MQERNEKKRNAGKCREKKRKEKKKNENARKKKRKEKKCRKVQEKRKMRQICVRGERTNLCGGKGEERDKFASRERGREGKICARGEDKFARDKKKKREKEKENGN